MAVSRAGASRPLLLILSFLELYPKDREALQSGWEWLRPALC